MEVFWIIFAGTIVMMMIAAISHVLESRSHRKKNSQRNQTGRNTT